MPQLYQRVMENGKTNLVAEGSRGSLRLLMSSLPSVDEKGSAVRYTIYDGDQLVSSTVNGGASPMKNNRKDARLLYSDRGRDVQPVVVKI